MHLWVVYHEICTYTAFVIFFTVFSQKHWILLRYEGLKSWDLSLKLSYHILSEHLALRLQADLWFLKVEWDEVSCSCRTSSQFGRAKPYFKISLQSVRQPCTFHAAGGLFMMHWVSTHLYSLPMSLYAFIFSPSSIFCFFLSLCLQFPPHLPYQWADRSLIKGGSSFPQSPVLLLWYRLVIGLHSLNFVSVIVKVQETPELKKEESLNMSFWIKLNLI